MVILGHNVGIRFNLSPRNDSGENVMMILGNTIRILVVPLCSSDYSLRSERILRVDPHALALRATHVDLKYDFLSNLTN